MKRTGILRVLALLLILVSGLSAQTIKRQTSLKNVKPYAWGDSTKPVKDPFWNGKILESVDRVLVSKGLKRIDLSANPDAIVTYSATIDNDVFYIGWEVQLRVDVRDPSQKVSLWYAKSSETFFDKSHKNVGKLQKMIEKTFKNYPPVG